MKYNYFCSIFRIKRASGVDFCDMLYIDDEKEHLEEVAGTCTGKIKQLL